MTRTLAFALSLGTCAALAACAGDGADPNGGRVDPEAAVEIAVAPLNLPEVTNALYTFSVRNHSGVTVAAITLDSAAYGSGQGSATYIAPCDADPAEQPNFVTASIAQVFSGLQPLAATLPPAQTREVECVANQDVLVEFDFTLVRSANQGFFDIKTTVEDIFCSAKLDCAESDQAGAAASVVIAFACGAGAPGLVDTRLYMTNIIVDCDTSGSASIAPDGDGWLPGTLVSDRPDPDNILTGVRVYRGRELYSTLDAYYWNVTFGLTNWAAASDCTVELQATATDGGLGAGAGGTAPYVTPPDYPVIRWNVGLVANDILTCEHPLGGNNGVDVFFPSDGWEFSNEYGGTGP